MTDVELLKLGLLMPPPNAEDCAPTFRCWQPRRSSFSFGGSFESLPLFGGFGDLNLVVSSLLWPQDYENRERTSAVEFFLQRRMIKVETANLLFPLKMHLGEKHRCTFY